MIEDLIVKCSMPISIVENVHFRHFLSVMDSHYTPIARATVCKMLDRLVQSVKDNLTNKLSTARTVNLTVDIWSDRKMRSFLGTTAHYLPSPEHIKKGQSLATLQSSLLSCSRIYGSHTGEKIAGELESVLDIFHLRQKVDCVITDNAANMRKALNIAFAELAEDDADDPDVDNPDLWNSLDEQDIMEVNNVITSNCRRERLSCFDHTIHLVVGDGLKSTKCVSTAIAKSCKTSSLLHTSALFKDAFEQKFGALKSIPAAVSTRWNSTLRQLESLYELDSTAMSELLEAQGHKNLVLTAKEWSQIGELIEILEPFVEATAITEGDQLATISYALPCVMGLIRHLNELQKMQKLKSCGPICRSLLASLHERFDGMLFRLNVHTNPRTTETDVNALPFGSDVYVLGAFFDPRFRLRWIDQELQLDEHQKKQLHKEVTGLV